LRSAFGTNGVTSESVKPLNARGLFVATLLAVLLLGAGACRQIVSFENDQKSSGVYISTTGYWPFSDATCGACIDKSCAGEATGCAADPTCKAYEGCLAECARGDSSCTDNCLFRVRWAGLSPETHQLEHCQASACSAACPTLHVTSGSGQTCGPLVAPADCESCCCDEFAACDNDPDCVAQAACWRQCQGDDPPLGKTCFGACMGRTVDAISSNLPPVQACLFDSGSRCHDRCFAAADWTCLGHVQSPDPSDDWWRQYGTVLDNSTLMGVPLQGFRVRGCVPRDGCLKPFAETLSDADGNVSLDFSNSPFGTTAYIEVSAPPGLNFPKHLFFEPNDLLNHSTRWDLSVYQRGSVEAVPLPDPTLGALLFFTYDCSGLRAAGVEVTASPAKGATTAYVTPGLEPDGSDTATLPAGIGTIINLPPGPVTLSMRRQSTQELIGIQHVVIEADAMTIVDLFPTPL
jgi:hypothetical protein